jgi:DNA invertase Pin-like site-specific DNA recombinase
MWQFLVVRADMAVYGYARVSTDDQDTSIQVAALKARGCSVVREEKKSGTTRNGRTELQTLLDFMRSGDVLMVTRIDRLARSMKDLQDLVHELKQKGVFLKATEQPIDTSTAVGKAFFDMLGVFAEFETSLRRERQLEGVKKAKADGKYKGTAPKIDRAEIARLRSDGNNVTQIARAMGISRESVYRIERGMRAT